MTIEVRRGSFIKQPTAGNQVVALTGWGFTPKLVIFYGNTYSTADGVVNDFLDPFMAFMAGSADQVGWACGTQSNNKNGGAGLYDGLYIQRQNVGPEGRAQFVSFALNEFTINWVENDNTIATRIHYIAIAGDDLTDIQIGTVALNLTAGNQVVSGVTAFTPKIGFFMASDQTTFPSTGGPNDSIGYGAAVSATKRYASGWNSKGDKAANSLHTNRCLVYPLSNDAALDCEVDFVSFDATGFTINIVDPPTTADIMAYVLLGGGANLNVDLGAFTSPASNQTQTVTTTDEPDLVFFSTANKLAGAGYAPNLQHSIGAMAGTNDSATVHWSNPDNKTPESASRISEAMETYTAATTLGAPDEVFDFAAFNPTNFQITYTSTVAEAREFAWWMIGGGVAGAYSMPADSGSYALTGTDAALVRDYTVIAESGGYALTGQAANLLRDLITPADPGAYALTGQAANLIRDLLIAADAGGYALTGQAANLLRDVITVADPGAYTLSGQAANLIRDLLVAADPGAYALTGQAANLLRDLRVAADAGAYAVNGQAANLVRDLLLAADPGAYTIVGTDANLTVSKVIAADAGAYTLTGQAATLLRDLIFAADAGAYAVNGQAATLLVSIVMAADAGGYAVTGQAATLLRDYVAPADPGAYTVSGQAANLLLDRIMAADAGAYALAGQDAGLLVSIAMAADAGAYSVNGQAANLLRDRIFAADAGGYALTGQAANLVRDLIIAADAGGYALTGQAANLLVSIALAADAGAYVVTGTAADLITEAKIVADAGAYSINGQAATLLRGIPMAADAGAYLLTGTDAGLILTRQLIADPGVYAVNGQAANLLRALIRQADPGAYTIIGQDADLVSLGIVPLILIGDATLVNRFGASVSLEHRFSATPTLRPD